MTCERAQAAISERMDGEHLPARVGQPLDEHLETCSDCRAFASNAARLRTTVRIRTAERIPDLVAPIMATIERDRIRPARHAAGVGSARPPRRLLAPVAAMIAVGIVAGSLAVGGPWQRPSTRPLAVADVIRGVRAAANALTSYHASFAITERGLATDVPTRSLSMGVWFSAPGRYRMDVVDHTVYPSSAWTPTDLRAIVDGPTTYRSGPTGCPSDLGSMGCPTTRAIVHQRVPVANGSPLPADLVLPLDTLSSARGVTVLGGGTVLGRPVIRVELPFDRAAPLFPFIRLGGTWRPFFAEDRVILSLDAQSWFPLRYSVFPSADPARRDWELRFGLAEEPPGRSIFDVSAVAFDEHRPPGGRFAIPGGIQPTVPLSSVGSRLGVAPLIPTAPGDLSLSSTVLPPGGPGAPQLVLTYSRGLSYLRVGERIGAGPPPLIDPGAERVQLAGGTGYYVPATADQGRRVSIHTGSADLFLESNLPRDQLLAVAASIPVRGEAVSSTATHRVSLTEAQARFGSPLEAPATLPNGEVLASVQVSTARGDPNVTLYYRQPSSDLAGAPVRLHLERAGSLPPVASESPSLLDVGGISARWTPAGSRLEWIDHGVYRMLDAPGLSLGDVLALARSLGLPR